jgi:hypothetical protein
MYAKSKSEFIKAKKMQYLEFEFVDELMNNYGCMLNLLAIEN